MDKLIYFQNILSLGLCAVGCLFLFLQAEGIRARIILACTLLLWVVDYSVRLTDCLLNNAPIVDDAFFSPVYLVMGSFLVQTIIPYVIEVVRPGWINGRRFLYLVLPWIGISGCYYGMLWLRNEPVTVLHSFDDLGAHLGEFNVWFRFVLLVMIFGYLCVMHWFSLRYRYHYDRWCNDNYADTARMDISWLRYIAWGQVCITIPFCFMLFNQGRFWYVIHQLAVDFVFLCAFYKGLFQENPYSEAFFHDTLDEQSALRTYDTGSPEVQKDEKNFADCLPGYMQAVETWMNTSHPYLRKDFKLMDVTDILPLNRSYLSRLFNEGFGVSFSQYVQRYRLEKAKELLLDQPTLPVRDVAFACGFASVSTFHAAFARQTGQSPNLYRQQAFDIHKS